MISAPAGDRVPELPDILPVLPLRDAVVFPYVIVPLSVGPEGGVPAIDRALADQRLVMLATQRDGSNPQPEPEDLHPIGTAGMIMRMLRLPDGRMRLLVQGLMRVRLEHVARREPYLEAQIVPLPPPAVEMEPEVEALTRRVVDGLEQAIHLGRAISPDVVVVAANLDDPGRLADLAASNLELPAAAAQSLLETLDPVARLRAVHHHLERELHLLALKQDIANQARDELDRNQREYFLRQELKAIQDELGEGDDFRLEIDAHRRRAEEKKLPEEAREELERQIRRLERGHPDSAETAVVRTFLDWLTGLPWGVMSEDRLDLERARAILDEDHYGLETVKERILEFLAVRKLKADAKGPILCFVGPPGVGKTSLGRAVARTLGRRFARLSLGGVHDEAEIRGHRRTYVGALPGRILQGLHQAGTSNPVFMLDEIDKIGADARGDPTAALLEVLDPEQNATFRDHYLGLPYDLSRVLFITTANRLEPVPPAFRDRLEVIRLSGYAEEEKVEITRRHLLPKARREHGLEPAHLELTRGGIQRIIRGYTRESGLRALEREIASLCRKTAMRVATGRRPLGRLDGRRVARILGPERHLSEALLDRHRVGIATGLAWTEHGGELMFIEVLAVPGDGKLHLTGKLGEVMKESAQTALTYARGYASRHGLEASLLTAQDLHVHAPAGAVSKDGPSAGVTIATALISILAGRPVDRSVAMTGELTLRGALLPIGGLKEKLLAAHAAGISTVLLPAANRGELATLPKSLRRKLRLRTFEHMDDLAGAALIGDAPGTEPRR
ncbi:MAG: endopeptidase La [Acidobacteria bacterium]|nr:MAG: endopeptidase La [Acidobacteriota bacterium]